ncbi:MAG: glycine cleavage system protein H [Deltaproteobacteria bacterium]|nr:MAG: glycine cleavage system protein H [Deltaproteobacteria bacterium]
MIAVIDMYASKGTEYLLILAYLAVLIPFWMLLARRGRRTRSLRTVVDWFEMPRDVGFHPGHTWAKQVAPKRVRVGMDDLAQSFVGTPEAIALPAVGDTLRRDQRAWSLRLEGREVPMLAPVDGKVVAVNQDVLDDPALLADAYERGWLLEVEAPPKQAALKELLVGERARTWMAGTVDALRARMGGELGPVMQDGGTPASGFGRQLGADWSTLCGQLFQTTELMAAPAADAPRTEEHAP